MTTQSTLEALKAERRRLWEIVYQEHKADAAHTRATITCPEDLLRPHTYTPAENAMATVQGQIMALENAEYRKQQGR